MPILRACIQDQGTVILPHNMEHICGGIRKPMKQKSLAAASVV